MVEDHNYDLHIENQTLRNEIRALRAHMQDLNGAFHVLYDTEPERTRLESQLRMAFLDMQAMRETILSMERVQSDSLERLGIRIAHAQEQITALKEEQESDYSEPGSEDSEDEGEGHGEVVATVAEPETTWTVVIEQ